jgi:hypothetical protein
MNTQLTIKSVPDTESKSCICSLPTIELWAVIPDKYGVKYPYPLKDAKFCTLCGRQIREVKHGDIDGALQND